MSRVFISFLGTNDYLPCTYAAEGKGLVSGVRFVQEAMAKIFCRNWSEQDRIVIFTTKDAYEKNWLDNGHTDPGGAVLDRTGLEQALAQKNLSCPISRFSIPEGKSEEEIWKCFSVFLNALNMRDEVYFDITHGYRSIPLLAFAALNYARVVKEITVGGIYYGAFEALGSLPEARKMAVEDRVAPIFDLTQFDALLNWAVAFDRFTGSGDAALASKLALEGVLPMLKATRGRDASASAVRNLADSLQNFSKTLSTCRGKDVTPAARWLKDNLKACQGIEVRPEMNPLLDKVQKQIEPFSGEEIIDGLAAARWCLDHNLFQQGFTILSEAIIGLVAREAGLDQNNRLHRQIASQAATIHYNRIPEENWKGPSSSHLGMAGKCLAFLDGSEGLSKNMCDLANLRNDINHAGFNDKPMAPKTVEKSLTRILNAIENAVSGK